jgi:hypothetical protein
MNECNERQNEWKVVGWILLFDVVVVLHYVRQQNLMFVFRVRCATLKKTKTKRIPSPSD